MVFKHFTDRLRSAGTTATNTLLHGSEQAEKIRQLSAMGFDPERARHALNSSGGNVDRAAELLLAAADAELQHHNDDIPSHDHRRNLSNSNGNRHQGGTHVAIHNDNQMRLAIEESLRVEQQSAQKPKQDRQAEASSKKTEVIDLTGDERKADVVLRKNNSLPDKKKKQTSKPPTSSTATIKSAAAINAGKAATTRHNQNQLTAPNTLEHTHPNVQLPEKMSNKSKEEQILCCANRLKTHATAVDTLLRVLTSVRNMPDNPKFRVIDRTNGNYVAHVKDKPGAEDLLLAMNYRRHGSGSTNELRLERHLLDDALLYLGISALEQMRMSKEYMDAKKLRAFHAEIRRIGEQNGSRMQQMGMTESETEIRLAFLSKCPKEPPEGRGARLLLQLGDESSKIEGGEISRRFDGDDTLEDVLNWLGGCYGNELLQKIRGEVREWCICDKNIYPILPLDVEKHGKKTLQYLGLFPSGKLVVRLSPDAWRERRDGDFGAGYDVHGSALGLGAR